MPRLTLSLLICTIPKRLAAAQCLWQTLAPQCTDRVQVLIDGSLHDPIGAKRQRLLQAASEDFVMFLDDDDTFANDGVARILHALDATPDVDCLATEGWVTFNGALRAPQRRYVISLACQRWHYTNGIYYRTPNHITPIRRTLAQSVPFPAKNHGEDSDWAMQLLPKLQTEGRVPGTLYTYHSRASGPTEG